MSNGEVVAAGDSAILGLDGQHLAGAEATARGFLEAVRNETATALAAGLPRERMLELGATALTETELLALQLGSGVRGHSVIESAAGLLGRFGSLRALARATLHELLLERGLGLARASRLVAAFEIGRRAARAGFDRAAAVRGAGDVARLLAPRLRDLRKEVFIALLLDGRHRLLREERVSEGSLTSSIVHPREVFGPAIRESAAAIIVAHNHPSGDPTPSREDIAVTRRLAEVGHMVGIDLLDHVVIGDPGFVSLRERGLFVAPALTKPSDSTAERSHSLPPFGLPFELRSR